MRRSNATARISGHEMGAACPEHLVVTPPKDCPNCERSSRWKIGKPENRKCGKVIPAGVAFPRFPDATNDWSTQPTHQIVARYQAALLKWLLPSLGGGAGHPDDTVSLAGTTSQSNALTALAAHPRHHPVDEGRHTSKAFIRQGTSARKIGNPEIRKIGKWANSTQAA